MHYKYPYIANAFAISTLLMLFNCYLTPNPYAAIHSGRVGITEILSETWYIAPAYGVIVGLIAAALWHLRETKIGYVELGLAMSMILSGVVTSRIVEFPQTYIYDALTLMLIGIAAHGDAQRASLEAAWYKRFLGASWGLVVLGLLLTIIRPTTFGHLGDFSRETRGEVALLTAVGLTALLVPIGIYEYLEAATSVRRWLGLIVVCFHLTITLLCAHRLEFFSSALLIGVCILCYARRSVKTVTVVGASMIAMGMLPWLIEYFMLGYDFSDDRVLNGRAELWQCHFDAWCGALWFGDGVGVVRRLSLHSGAVSDIGALRWFSEYGMVFGVPMLFLVFRSIQASYKIIINHRTKKISASPLDLICAFMLIKSLVGAMTTQYARALMFDGLFFYYSVFYVTYRLRTLPYQSDFGQSVSRRFRVSVGA